MYRVHGTHVLAMQQQFLSQDNFFQFLYDRQFFFCWAHYVTYTKIKFGEIQIRQNIIIFSILDKSQSVAPVKREIELVSPQMIWWVAHKGVHCGKKTPTEVFKKTMNRKVRDRRGWILVTKIRFLTFDVQISIETIPTHWVLFTLSRPYPCEGQQNVRKTSPRLLLMFLDVRPFNSGLYITLTRG